MTNEVLFLILHSQVKIDEELSRRSEPRSSPPSTPRLKVSLLKKSNLLIVLLSVSESGIVSGDWRVAFNRTSDNLQIQWINLLATS